ncbi:MAG: AAA family ATPase [Eubacteriales bacterium]|nr:AAA family ATPase [Eubacteriales bacterium]
MLKRKMLDRLIEWKKNKGKECLLVKGARQVGKTYIIEKFGHEYYKSYIYINLIEKPAIRDIFEGDLSAEEIYKRMSLSIPNIKFADHDTLIFLDEIQACPQARTAFKFLAIDNRYDIIGSGSLLGISYKEIESIPVGYETQIEMHSLDFEEFLWAVGLDDKAVGYIKEYFDKKVAVPAVIHYSMMKYLREYVVTGGMPAVINKYRKNSNFSEVQAEQQKIIDRYLDDISKYASAYEKPKARNCYLSIPKQLAKENKKFQFAVVEKGSSARKYEKDNWYKLYLNDVGILVSMYGFEMKKAIINDTLTGEAKGGIYENLVADMLIKRGYKLYYFRNEKNSQEIEFMITKNSGVIPIEVKSGNGATLSLKTLLMQSDIQYGYKLISGNVGISGKKITLPLYMAMFL